MHITYHEFSVNRSQSSDVLHHNVIMILKLRNILSVWCGHGYIFLAVENILRIGDRSLIRCIPIGLWGGLIYI